MVGVELRACGALGSNICQSLLRQIDYLLPKVLAKLPAVAAPRWRARPRYHLTTAGEGVELDIAVCEMGIEA